MKSNKWIYFLGCVFFVLMTGTAWAEVVEPKPEDWANIIVQLTSSQLSVLAVVAAAVQAIMLLLKSKLGDGTGRLKVVLVSLMSLVGGVLSLKLKGMEWGSALVHSSVLAAAQVFLYDLYKYLKPDAEQKPEPKPEPVKSVQLAAKRKPKK